MCSTRSSRVSNDGYGLGSGYRLSFATGVGLTEIEIYSFYTGLPNLGSSAAGMAELFV